MLKSDYRRGSHTVYELHLHVVWVTKCRRPVLAGVVGERVRELVRELCAAEDVTILSGHVARDHVHLFVSIPPQVTISRLLRRLKGKTSYQLLAEFTHLRKKFWGRHLWARGYFVCSSGNVTDDVIAAYVEHRSEMTGTDDGFRVEGQDADPVQPTRSDALPPRSALLRGVAQSILFGAFFLTIGCMRWNGVPVGAAAQGTSLLRLHLRDGSSVIVREGVDQHV